MFHFFHGEMFWTLCFLSLIRTGNQVGPMGRTQARIAILQLFSHGQTVHEAPRHLRAEGPSTRGSLFLLLSFGGFGSPHVGSHPPWAAGIQEDLVSSSLLTQFPGLDSGQGHDADFRHFMYIIIRPALLPVHPVLCVFHKFVHEPHQLLLCDGLTPQFLLQFLMCRFSKLQSSLCLTHSPLCLKHNTDHCLEGCAQTWWVPNLLGRWTSNFHLMASYQFLWDWLRLLIP